MFRALSTAALLALTVSAAQANAVAHTSVAVTYGDLDLSNPQDAAILADRLQGAASLVCLNATDTKAPVRKVLVRKCVDSVVNKATAQIQSELEAGPSRMIRANLVGVREKVASAEISVN